MFRHTLIATLFACSFGVYAQEFRCTVQIDDRQVQTQEKQILQQLKNDMEKFMNETKFTNETYEQKERIKTNILVSLQASQGGVSTDVTQGTYAATVQIQSVRPVYGSTYESPVLVFFDQNFAFNYQPSQPLFFNENANISNLTALLAFYAYVMLALDADSFTDKGASPIIEKILNITNNSQQSGALGWSNNNNRNRFWLSENLNSVQFVPFREAMYIYHRKGLDVFAQNPAEGRKKVLEALEKLKAINQLRAADALLIDAFMDAKMNELLKIFAEGTPEDIKKAADIMSQIDPQNSSQYRALVK